MGVQEMMPQEILDEIQRARNSKPHIRLAYVRGALLGLVEGLPAMPEPMKEYIGELVTMLEETSIEIEDV